MKDIIIRIKLNEDKNGIAYSIERDSGDKDKIAENLKLIAILSLLQRNLQNSINEKLNISRKI